MISDADARDDPLGLEADLGGTSSSTSSSSSSSSSLSGGAADDPERTFLIMNINTKMIHKDTSDGMACNKQYPHEYEYKHDIPKGARLCKGCFP